MKATWLNRIEGNLPQSRIRKNFPLKSITTLRVGGNADCLVDLESEEELLKVFEIIREESLPFLVLGKGSNLLVPDEGFPGIVLRLGKSFQTVTRIVNNRVKAGAGCANPVLVEKCRQWGLEGIEFLIAVPGTVGGAVAMNAGAHGGETADFLSSVKYFDLNSGILSCAASVFQFDYRSSDLRASLGKLVLEAEFELAIATPDHIKSRMDEIQQYRRDTQPRDFPNCGSVFKNPPGDFAARLIEQSGLKGTIIGDAQISEKHANFIVNKGEATSMEVIELIELARKTVQLKTGVSLELELQIISSGI